MDKRLAFVWLLALVFTLAASEPTSLSYIIEVEEENGHDFIEMTIKVTAQDPSLTAAITQAKEKTQKVKQLYEQICKKLVKDKSECKEAVEIGKVEIEPSYKQQKKETIYEKITVNYDVVITIKQMNFLGDLVDEMVKMEGIVIDTVEAVADQEKAQNKFLEESLEKSKELCAQLGKKFIKVASVEELREEPEEPEEEEPAEEGEEEEEEEEQPTEEEEQPEEETTSYRITIECDGQLEKAKKGKKEATK